MKSARDTERARGESAWHALLAVLHRAEHDGRYPARLLAEVSSVRELRTARSVSEVLAWRITRHAVSSNGLKPQRPERDSNARPTA